MGPQRTVDCWSIASARAMVEYLNDEGYIATSVGLQVLTDAQLGTIKKAFLALDFVA